MLTESKTEMLYLPGCREVLKDPESHALAAVLAASAFLGEELIDEDEQPYAENELALLLKSATADAHPEVVTKIIGLLNSIAGDEYTQHPVHFSRLTGAIVEGDPFVYEDEGEEPTLEDAFWGLYQVEMITDDEITAELGPRVLRLIERIEGSDVEDLEGLREFLNMNGETDEPTSPILAEIADRRQELALQLARIGVKKDWVDAVDTELANLLPS